MHKSRYLLANGIHYFSDVFIKNLYVSFASINIFIYPWLCFSDSSFDWWVSTVLCLKGKPVTMELPELLCLTNNVPWHLQAFRFWPGGKKDAKPWSSLYCRQVTHISHITCQHLHLNISSSQCACSTLTFLFLYS